MVTLGIVRAIEYLYTRGIIHRDLHPSIIVDNNGRRIL
jgi:serine/threonine protein kinase